jgi:hypothetical protein
MKTKRLETGREQSLKISSLSLSLSLSLYIYIYIYIYINSVVFSPQANYTDRETAAYRQS